MAEPKAPDLTGRPRLNWQQAVGAMRAGHYVRRASDCYLKLVQRALPPDDPDYDSHHFADAPIYESGQEGCYLAHAWGEDDKAVRVFMGASSKVPFVPDGEHMSATDWVVVEKNEC